MAKESESKAEKPKAAPAKAAAPAPKVAPATADAPDPAAGGDPQQAVQQVTVKDDNVAAGYANFCRVSSSPEELILDLGLNPQPYATGPVTVEVQQRIILNHFTAKRLLSALSMALQRHEQAFGVLETDVRKRVKVQ